MVRYFRWCTFFSTISGLPAAQTWRFEPPMARIPHPPPHPNQFCVGSRTAGFTTTVQSLAPCTHDHGSVFGPSVHDHGRFLFKRPHSRPQFRIWRLTFATMIRCSALAFATTFFGFTPRHDHGFFICARCSRLASPCACARRGVKNSP